MVAVKSCFAVPTQSWTRCPALSFTHAALKVCCLFRSTRSSSVWVLAPVNQLSASYRLSADTALRWANQSRIRVLRPCKAKLRELLVSHGNHFERAVGWLKGVIHDLFSNALVFPVLNLIVGVLLFPSVVSTSSFSTWNPVLVHGCACSKLRGRAALSQRLKKTNDSNSILI